MYAPDSYSHVTNGLIYIDTSFPGSGIDETLYACAPEGCRCTICDKSCPCVKRSNECYDGNKLVRENVPIYECNVECQCSKSCGNRLVQNGPVTGLTIDLISGKGLALISGTQMGKGSFVCEYAGEIIGVKEANARFNGKDTHNYILIMQEHFGDRDYPTVIDPTIIGNIGRYVNHSCDPNLTIVPVRINSLIPIAALFASKDINVGDELCYSYESVAGLEYSAGVNFSTTVCLCNSKLCKGFLPSNKSYNV